MQDRFKFRAKDKETGEWRYGYYAELPCGLGSSGVNSEYADTDSFILTCTKKQSALYSNAEPHEVFYCEQFRVDGETLSQCTGLRDKNGKLIYEKDILLSPDYDEPYMVIVEWDNEEGYIVKAWNGKEFEYALSDDTLESLKYFQIIDNEFENPELLVVKE